MTSPYSVAPAPCLRGLEAVKRAGKLVQIEETAYGFAAELLRMRLLPNSNDAFALLYDTGRGVAVQPGGRIVVGGGAWSYAAGEPVLAGYRGNDAVIIRLTPDGALDTSFRADGFAAASSGGIAHGAALAIEPHGDVVVAGVELIPRSVQRRGRAARKVPRAPAAVGRRGRDRQRRYHAAGSTGDDARGQPYRLNSIA
jgi:hypothetical protein